MNIQNSNLQPIVTRVLLVVLWLVSLGILVIRSNPWETVESKDRRVSDETARTLTVVVGREVFGKEALAVVDYNGQQILVKQRLRFPEGFSGHFYRPEFWLWFAITFLLLYKSIFKKWQPKSTAASRSVENAKITCEDKYT
jgi:hypothetical protein